VFGTHNVGAAAELLRRAREDGPVVEIREESEELPSALPVRRNVPHAAWVTIQIGCDNSCAFCIVPAVRGREVSRPFGEIVAEVEGLAASGVVEVTLLGQNVNSYGREGGRRPRPRFAELLREVGGVPGIERVRFTSPHPKDLRPEVVEAMADTPAVCEHLHLPLQSGSDRVLAAMHRGYRAGRYLEKLRTARDRVPDLAVTTDVIVGFPGETEEDFKQTLEVAEQVGYDGAFTFAYSPRRGTEAATLPDQVPHEVKVQRLERLVEVIQHRAHERAQRFVDRTLEVLVEGPSRTDPSRLRGRTSHNKVVNFDGLAAPGQLVQVKITGATSQTLSGHESIVSRTA
jgi:tRNA-2-methylthio-N6-dimethylallyladenosine synthase